MKRKGFWRENMSTKEKEMGVNSEIQKTKKRQCLLSLFYAALTVFLLVGNYCKILTSTV